MSYFNLTASEAAAGFPAGSARSMTDRPIPDETMREATVAYNAVCDAEPMNRKCIEIIARALLEAEKRGMRRGVDFVLGHYEVGPMPFTLDPVDPETWWSKVQVLPHDPARLLPASRAHFEARLRRWHELALAEIGEG